MALNFSNIWFSKKKRKQPPQLSAVRTSVTNLLHQSWQGGRQCCSLWFLAPPWLKGIRRGGTLCPHMQHSCPWSQSTQQMKFLEGHHVIWMVVKSYTVMGVKRVCPQAVRGHLAKEELISEFNVTVLLPYWQSKRWSDDWWHKYFS